MSLLDIDERILEVAKLADILKSPIVDGKEFPEVDVALVEGAICNEEHLHEIQVIRQKSKVLIALGDCAITGNVARLRNCFPTADVFNRSYVEAESNVPGKVPSKVVHQIIPKVVPLSAVVKVDVTIPGCPPNADLIFQVLFDHLSGKKPSLEGAKYG
jgi:NAD-reducing hydrogenase small subunit